MDDDYFNEDYPGEGQNNPRQIEIQDDDSLAVSELDISLGSFPAYAGTRESSTYVPPSSQAAANRRDQG